MTNLRQVLKLIGIGFGLAAVVFAGVGLLLPREYTVTRSVTIQAGPERVHEFVGHLDQWPRWTPWLRSDPPPSITTGPQITGTGATQNWQSQSGGGELVLTRCQADWGVAFDLVLGKKQRRSTSSLQYQPTDAGTVVVWQLHGNSGLDIFGRYFNLLINPLMGPMLDEGLQRLKVLAEEPIIPGDQ